MTRIVGVIQARLGSTRLPKKVLAPVGTKPMLWHLVRRLRASEQLNEVIVATADTPENRPIVDICEAEGIPCYAGSEADLVDRFYQSGLAYGADALVRITGDCPLVDPDVVDRMVSHYLAQPEEIDFLANNRPPSYPHGLDVELFSMAALKRQHDEISDPFKREWFTLNFTDSSMNFKVQNLAYDQDLSSLRWTVDYPEDLEFVRQIYAGIDRPDRVFRMIDTLNLLARRPDLEGLNAHHIQVHHDGDRGIQQARAAWESEQRLRAAS